MSKRMLPIPGSSRHNRPASPMFDSLENRSYMTVGPTTIANASSNDSVYESATGDLHVIYYNTATRNLNYQQFHGDGTSEAPVTIDAANDVGQYLSLAEDSTGVLHAAYYDGVNGDLKYARRDLAGTWSTEVVESKNTVGLYPSIAVDANDEPVISYYAKTGGNLKVARFDGSAWSNTVIDSTDDVGRYSALALNPVNNLFGISYEDSTLGHFRYAQEASNHTFSAITVDATTKSGGGYTSLNFQNGNPAFSYYDAFNADLKYAERSSKGKWSTAAIATKGSQGLYSDLAYTFDTNQPAIVYYNKTADNATLAYRTPGGVWNYAVQLTGGGRNVSATDSPSVNGGVPDLFLVYTDSASGGLIVDTF